MALVGSNLIRKIKFEEKEVQELYISGVKVPEIAKIYHCSTSPIYRFLHAKNLTKTNAQYHRRYTLNESFFDEIDSEAKAYFLGFIAADGHNSELLGDIIIQICIIDIEILHTFKKYLQCNIPLRIFPPKQITLKGKQYNQHESVKFRIYSRHMSNTLLKYGLTQRKTQTMNFPKQLINSPYLNHFMRGYFDGDGCITSVISYYKDKTYSCKSVEIAGTEQFLSVYAEMLTKFCGCKRNKIPYSQGIYTYKIAGKIVESIRKFLYKDASIFLERKKKRFDSDIDLWSKYGS